jgi:hypothetical protein
MAGQSSSTGIFDGFEVIAGTDQLIGFRLKTGGTPSTPIDITGWTFMLSVRNKITDELELNAVVTVTDAKNGTGQIQFPAVASAGKPETDVIYDLIATDTKGERTCLFKGEGTIRPTATRQ